MYLTAAQAGTSGEAGQLTAGNHNGKLLALLGAGE